MDLMKWLYDRVDPRFANFPINRIRAELYDKALVAVITIVMCSLRITLFAACYLAENFLDKSHWLTDIMCYVERKMGEVIVFPNTSEQAALLMWLASFILLIHTLCPRYESQTSSVELCLCWWRPWCWTVARGFTDLHFRLYLFILALQSGFQHVVLFSKSPIVFKYLSYLHTGALAVYILSNVVLKFFFYAHLSYLHIRHYRPVEILSTILASISAILELVVFLKLIPYDFFFMAMWFTFSC